MTSREKFEALDDNFNLWFNALFEPNANKLHYDIAWSAWQAATEASQKEIEGLKEDLSELRQQTNIRCAQVQERDITIVELKAREKVLVEALNESIECFEQSARGFIPYEQALEKCKQALAKVRGE